MQKHILFESPLYVVLNVTKTEVYTVMIFRRYYWRNILQQNILKFVLLFKV